MSTLRRKRSHFFNFPVKSEGVLKRVMSAVCGIAMNCMLALSFRHDPIGGGNEIYSDITPMTAALVASGLLGCF